MANISKRFKALQTLVVPGKAYSLDDALKLKLGMPATVYVPFEDRRYLATVSAVGLAAVNAASLPTMEGGLNETLIKLEFDDKRVRLPANARVNVWVRTLNGFGGGLT